MSLVTLIMTTFDAASDDKSVIMITHSTSDKLIPWAPDFPLLNSRAPIQYKDAILPV